MKPLALITGGQRGIGLGIAHTLVANGFRVALAAEAPENAAEVREALNMLGAGAHYFRHDLRDVAAIPALLDQVEHMGGPIVSFISNAGVPAKIRGDLLEVAEENFAFVMDVNLKGAFFLAQSVAKRMEQQAREKAEGAYRSLIFVTSVSATMVSVERAEYCISKAAASMMVQLFAARLAEAGIGVFELRPGIIATNMTEGIRDSYTARIEGGLVPALRWGVPGDIGAVVLPLVQGQMAFSSGAVIPVDGGLSIPRL